MPIVLLRPDEVLHAAMVGVTREIDNRRNRRQDRYGASDRDGWGLHIEGACGEFAVAKLLGLFWSGNLGNLRAPDVANLQVRTRSRHEYDLLIHPPEKDPPGDRFVLVTGRAPRLHVRGWCYGYEAQQDQFWRVDIPNPAYCVAAAQLHAMETIDLESCMAFFRAQPEAA